MSTTQTALVTFEEFIQLPHPPSGHLELHHGEVILVPPRRFSHAEIQQTLIELLLPRSKGKGFVTIEFPFRTAGHEAWQADVGFVCQERRVTTGDYLAGAPDLVIEVLSPNNTMDEVNDRMDVCLSNGCRSFWVVDPKRRTVSVTEGDVTRQYRASMSIPLSLPLEGAIQVADIFAQVLGT